MQVRGKCRITSCEFIPFSCTEDLHPERFSRDNIRSESERGKAVPGVRHPAPAVRAGAGGRSDPVGVLARAPVLVQAGALVCVLAFGLDFPPAVLHRGAYAADRARSRARPRSCTVRC